MNAAAITAWLAAQSVHIAVVFTIVFVIDAWLAHRSSTRWRAALWAALFVKLLLPPHWSSPVSITRLFAEDGEAVRLLDARLITESDVAAVWPVIVAGVWLVGCALSSTLAGVRMWRSQREWTSAIRPAPQALRRRFARLATEDGSQRIPRLFVHPHASSAASLGLFAPIIVLPEDLLGNHCAREREHVLMHELAHVRRRDAWRALAWTAARCVYWFHPLVHAAARRAELLREIACDEAAIASAHDSRDAYRRTLLALARPLLARGPAVSGFGVPGAMILARLAHLAEPCAVRRRRFDLLPAVLFVALCACCLPLGTTTAFALQLPSLDEVEGCFQKRFLVLAEMARQDSTAVRSSAR